MPPEGWTGRDGTGRARLAGLTARVPDKCRMSSRSFNAFLGTGLALAVCAAPAAVQVGQARHTLPLCTQGAPTFCACTPGLDCMMGAAQAAFQPTQSAVTLCCFKA